MLTCTHSSKGPNILPSPGPISPSPKEPYRTSTNHPGFKAERLPAPANSPYNTPILAVRKPNGSSHLVQDLRIINSAVLPIFPIVSNPYTLLSSIPSSTTYFSVLDLKDAFFTVPLHPDSQDLFAFTWTDTFTQVSSQLTWTVLPQGFRDSPHLWSNANPSPAPNPQVSSN